MSTKKKHHTPSLRRHKATNQAFVELNGRRIYLGVWGRPETDEAYHRKLAEWIANGRRLPVLTTEVTVIELCAAYWVHAKNHYRHPDGTPTSELNTVKRALRTLKDLYGSTRATDFGPMQLKAIRHQWIEGGLARKTVNHMMGTVKRVFKWGVSEGMLSPQVFGALQAVGGLQRGRSEARETEPVKPVPSAHIDGLRPHVSRQVWALVQLQLLTGARGGELLKLRAVDFDTTGQVWTVSLDEHKTRYRGRERVLYFGPQAQSIIREFMGERPLTVPLFSPKEAEAERRVDAPSHRRPNQTPTPRLTHRQLNGHYSPETYAQAIARGCAKAGVPHWSPHRLRHNAKTHLRKEFGLEAAQVILGHARADVTQVYAERDHERAVQIIAEIG